ncbi:hypothetical protein BH24BAC1_BH24BAC1_38020 [soil metagenome]
MRQGTGNSAKVSGGLALCVNRGMSTKYKIRDQQKLYFLTFKGMRWVDVFTRP